MKKLIFLFMFLLLFPLVNAQPFPFQTSEEESELTIVFPKFNVLEFNRDFDFRFHVYNTSNGVQLSNETVDCYFHLYNDTGKRIYIEEDIDSVIDHKFTFRVDVDGNNFSEVGNYAYLAHCNTSDSGGFISTPFIVTRTGIELTESKSIMYIGLLALLVFLFVVNIWAISISPSKDNRDEEGTLISINKLKYLRPVLIVIAWFLLMSLIFISSNIALAYLGTELLGNLLFNIFHIMMLFTPIMLLLWFIYIFYSVFQDKEMKKYLDRGIIE